MNELSQHIIDQAMQGNASAFKPVVLHYSCLINRLAFRYVGCPDAADDITQDTFIKAFKAIAGYQKKAKFSTWLGRITTNASIDYLRKHKYQNQMQVMESLETEPHNLDAHNNTSGLDAQIDLSTQLKQALNTLTHKERLAFTMKHYQGYSIEETAEALEINSNACKQTIYRAVQKLRKYLTPMVNA